MMVSFNVSPFEELVTLGSVNPITRAPSLFAAVSKLSRVRVEGSKKRVATTLPSKILRLGFFSNSKGELDGLRTKSRAVIESLKWDGETVEAKIKSEIDQTITISYGNKSETLSLKQNETATVEF